MKPIFLFFGLLTSVISMAQDMYSFDYYTIYEYTENETSKEKSYELTYSNSKNPDCHFIVLEDEGKIIFNYLVDNGKKVSYLFEPVSSLADVPKATLKFDKSVPFNVTSQRKNVYDITRKADTTTITRYKSAKKKKVISQCVVVTAPTEITTLQRYNFFPFRNPLFIERFEYDNPELIKSCYFIEKGKKVHFRKLQKIEQTNFTVTVPKSDNTKK